ncbi:unnamed protein product, partial [Symbiodinium sp. CCMP2456]
MLFLFAPLALKVLTPAPPRSSPSSAELAAQSACWEVWCWKGLSGECAASPPTCKTRVPRAPEPFPGAPAPRLQVLFASAAASSATSRRLGPGPLCFLCEPAVVLPNPCSTVCAQALAFGLCVWGDMEAALAEARCAAVSLVLDFSYGGSSISGFRIFEDRGRRGCWRQMKRLCSESSQATHFLEMAGATLGAGSLDFFRSQPRRPKEQRVFDAVQRVRELLAAAPPPRASSPVVEAGLLAVELVLDPLASEEARLGLHVWPGSSPTQAYRKMMKLCHPDKLPNCAKAASAAIELSSLSEAVQGERDDFRGAPLTLAETRLIEAVRRAESILFTTAAVLVLQSRPLLHRLRPHRLIMRKLIRPDIGAIKRVMYIKSRQAADPGAPRAPEPAAASAPPGPDPEDDGDDDMGDEGDPEPGCEDGKMTGWLHYEPVNAAELDRALNSDAVRRFTEFNLFDSLLSLRRRLVKIRNGVGLLPVWQRESRHPPGMPGRVFCGIGCLPRPEEVGGKRKADEEKREEFKAARAALIAQLPKAIQREILVLELPDALVGPSAFSYPRLVKYFCRHALDVVEVDLVNSFYQLLSKEFELPEALRDYVTHREATLQLLVSGLNSVKADYENKAAKEARRRAAKAEDRRPWSEEDEPSRPSKPLTRQDAKGLLIAMGFGMSASNWCSKHLGFVPRSAEYDPLLDLLASIEKAVGGVLIKCRYASLERRALEAFKRAAGEDLAALEHDGVAVARESADAVVVAAAELGLEVDVKETPDPLQYAAEEHPEFNWSLQAKRPYREFAEVRDACLVHISLRRVRPNGSDFADFVASLLAPVVNVPHEDGEKRTTFEFFDGRGFWVPKHKDDMGALIRMSLKNLSRPAYAGPFTPPEPLNDSCWTKSLVDEVLGLLSGHTMAPLDADRQAQPCDRMSLHAEATSAAWVPPVATQLFSKVETFLRTRGRTLEENEEGLAVVEAFEELKPHSGLLKLLRKYGSWLQVLYILRLFARAIVALERLCELFYLHGPGSSGKDVLMLILLRFLGYEPQHYGLLVSGRYFVAGAKSGKESASPQLDQMRGKRFIWGSEVPEHEDLDTDFLKALCEQGGAPLTGRGLYRNPRSFRPMGVFCATSNFPPKVKQIDDDGWARRAREWQTEARFVARPTKITEHKADDSLKKKINDGCFHAEMNFFAFGLFNSLSEELNPGTELMPKPPQMVLLEEQNRENAKTVDKFLLEHCERVAQYNQGCPWSAFVDALKAYLDCDRKVARTRLTSAGIKMHNAGTKNVPTDNYGSWKLKH